MKKPTPWIRSYREALHNPKILSLNDRQFRMWQCCLWMADNDGVLPKMRDVALHLRVTTVEAEQIICDLIEAELIDVSSPGTAQRSLTMHDWKSHQYIDHSTDRVRKFRNKNKEKPAPKAAQDETRFTPLPKHPEPDPETDKGRILEPSPSEQAAARERAKDQGFNFGFGKGRRKERVVTRAEGLGIKADEIIQSVASDPTVKNPSSVFTWRCLQELQQKLPGIDEELVRDALWGKDGKSYAVLFDLMAMAPS